ncbi:MAG: tetratricopeptide repeat protein [Alphaproteobacteria bacterium]|nr:tetratricopeptide repeat protein [Alphaproteobacteria bacterium]
MKKKNIPEQELDFTDVFFKEVSEDVHNDNLKAFWKKYGVQVVAFTALCLTIAVSFETIKHWRDLQNQRWSNAFAYAQVLQTQGKQEDSLKALQDIADNGNAIYADLAAMKKINILFEQGNKDAALTALSDFIKNAHNDKLKNAALIKLASYKIDTAGADEITALLKPLDGSVWEAEAKELIALTLLRENNVSDALAIYQGIIALPNINDILRARAQNMISVLTSNGE